MPFCKGAAILSNANAHLISAGGHFTKAENFFSRLPISSAPISFENKSSCRFLFKARPNGRLSRQKQPNGQTSGLQIPHYPAQSIFGKLQFYQCQAQWQFYQSRSNQMARLLEISHKLQFRYYPAQSTYQRPGKAIFSQSHQWPLYHMAALSRQKQLNCKTPRFEPWIANSHNFTQKVYQRQSQLLLTNGNFVTGRPSCQRPTAICHFSKADGRFSKRRPSCQKQMAVLSKPMAILSRPMAVLSSRGAPGARLSRQNQSKREMPRLKAPMAVLSRPGPMAV